MFKIIVDSLRTGILTERKPFEVRPPFGFPVIDFPRCTLCEECARACPTGAIHTGTAGPGQRTLSLSYASCIQCRACVEACPEKAVSGGRDVEVAAFSREQLQQTASFDVNMATGASTFRQMEMQAGPSLDESAATLRDRIHGRLGRSLHVRQVDAGSCNGCELEIAATANPLMISLDNEPDLWQHTHARLRGDSDPKTQAGRTATYAEMVQRTTDYADAAKDVNPAALVFGPVNYGWQGMIRFQDAADANNRDFLEFYLAQMNSAATTTGHRLVDVLDVHWYPEARGTCLANPMDGCRVTDEDTDAGVVAARKQAPRSLWDPTYTEDSWIAQFSTNGPIRLLPRLEDKIAANYPGTKLAITEYNYGAANHVSGAIAQADALGVFGREGLFAATLWRLVANNNFINGGFEMFRNYDGANGSFGDTSIRATNTDAAAASVYASVDAGNPNRMVVVAINKNDVAQSAGISVSHTVQFRTARVYALTSANPVPQRQADIDITLTNAFQYTMPANSVTTLVLLP